MYLMGANNPPEGRGRDKSEQIVPAQVGLVKASRPFCQYSRPSDEPCRAIRWLSTAFAVQYIFRCAAIPN